MSEQLLKALQAEWKVVFYRRILKQPLVEKFLFLVKEVAKPLPVPSQILPGYYDFVTALIAEPAFVVKSSSNPWRDYILDLLLADENFFSRQAEVIACRDIPEKIVCLAEQDLRLLQVIASVSSAGIKKELSAKIGKNIDIEGLPEWENFYFKGIKEKSEYTARDNIKSVICEAQDWGASVAQLAGFYRENGVGIFGMNHAFRWVRQNGEGSLVGVKNPDNIQMSQLYEYEREQAKIIQNTEQFLAGYPANNVLLYGDRGTGKSSTVKALINLYGKKGLRLIEIQKNDLADFPIIIDQLAQRPLKFILFVDDLSFTEDEGQYREMKALLEGGLETRPHNVLVYATSNRRHLVQENFSDRQITGYDQNSDDVRFMDTLQEKLSLADRFGITVTFITPDQSRYLAIVEKMATERGLAIAAEELRERALKWELNFNARSARTARQFIDYLEGRLDTGKKSQ